MTDQEFREESYRDPSSPDWDPERVHQERREKEMRERSVTAQAQFPPRNGNPRELPAAYQARAQRAAEDAKTDPAAAGRLRELQDEAGLAQVQAAVEGVIRGDRVEFMGEWFRISDRVGVMPLMKFANAADAKLDTSDLAALSAMYDMLRDCIYGGTESDTDPRIAALKPGDKGYDAGDWHKFERHAIRMKAGADDLMPVTQQVVEILTSRPTP
jgi:hypothetical protein